MICRLVKEEMKFIFFTFLYNFKNSLEKLSIMCYYLKCFIKLIEESIKRL